MALSDNLVAFWKLADTADSVGTNNLTNNNGVSFANAGTIGNCATFSGANYLSIADNAALSHNSSLTIAGWFYLANVTTGTERMVAKWNATSEYRIYKEVANLKFNIDNSNDASASLGSIGVNTWHSFIAVFDSVGQTVQIWIDNSITNGSTASNGGLADGTSDFSLGAIAGAEFMTGRLDAVGIWKQAFSSQDRIDFHNGGAGWEPSAGGTVVPVFMNQYRQRRN